jgi:hypothetical protein
MLALGGTPFRGLVIGATLMVQGVDGTFSGGPPGATGYAGAIAPIFGGLVDWYPSPQDGWHLGGALGLGGVGLTDSANNNSNGYGLGVSILGGYDWWIGPQWSLGLIGVLATSPAVRMTYQDQTGTGYELMPVTIALEGSLLYH